LAKAFDHSAVISNLIPKEELADVNSIDFSLQQNGQTVQQEIPRT
jgi:2-keto-4-pentenoate hydratase/2-oxohepta-3-ene-1,7-dioic acid hydratase in catechol pathway